MDDTDALRFSTYLNAYAAARGGGDITAWAKIVEARIPAVAALVALAADDAARGLFPRRWDQVCDGVARITAPAPGAGAPPAAG